MQKQSRVFRNGDPLGARSRAELWMRNQGPGYRDYDSWLSSRSFSGVNKAAVFMAEILPEKRPRADSSLHAFLFRGTHLYQTMPVIRVIDLAATGVSVLRPFPKEFGVPVLVHSNDHPPRHIHVQVLSRGEKRATPGRTYGRSREASLSRVQLKRTCGSMSKTRHEHCG